MRKHIRRGRKRGRPPPHKDHRPEYVGGFQPVKSKSKGSGKMTVYVMRSGKLVDTLEATPRVQVFGVAPHVISDSMGDTRHMANGSYYNSKSEFRKATKAAGCIEVGSDQSVLKPRKPVTLSRQKRVDNIKQAIQQLKKGAVK